MNQKFQKILDIIRQSENLDAEQKDNLIKAVKDADKELEITAFKLERTEKVKKTTAILLEETIEELEQKRKAVEQHNRELEIESSLERIRSQAMSMRKPDDLLNICEILFKEFVSLGFTELRNAMINIHNDDNKTFLNYDYSDEIGKSVTPLNFDTHPVMEKQIMQSRMANDAFSEAVYEGKDLEEWKEFRKKYGEKDDPRIKNITALYYYFYSIGNGTIGISTFTPIGREKLNLLKRFRNVFSLSYQRYSDIALAEAQAREAQIEASLERVRAVAMSMHKSDDLLGICEVSFNEFKKLGFDNLRNAVIHILDDERQFFMDYDYSDYLEGSINKISYDSHSIIGNYLNQIKKADDAFAEVIVEGSELESWKDFRRKGGQRDDPKLDEIPALYYYLYSIGVGDIGISTFKPISESQIKILKRFRNVFDLAYRRYNDISLAEAQARESQIQLALERIRARTMAMQRSDELAETAHVLFQQFSELGKNPDQLSIGIVNETEKVLELWLSVQGNQMDRMFKVPVDEPIVINKIYDAWKNQKKSLVIDISGDDLEKYNTMRNSISGYTAYNEIKSSKSKEGNRRVIYCSFFPKGLISLATPEPGPDETLKLLERFVSVFDLTYTRFLDLKKAEAQAREANIEAALERVRSRTMGMHKSEELAETASVLFKQLIELGIEPNRLYIAIVKDETGNAEFWITDEDGTKVSSGFSANLNDNRSFLKMYMGWKEKKKSLTIDMQGLELQEYFQHLSGLKVPFRGGLSQKRRVQNIAYFSHGFIGIASPDLQPEETVNLLERFAAVFNLTYRRFLDLQQAEAQTYEARIEAALERVRSRTMGMQQSEELAEVASLLFKQISELGISHWSSGFHIWNADEISTTAWMSGPDGSILTPFTIAYNKDPFFKQIYAAMQSGKDIFVMEMGGEELAGHYKYMLSDPNNKKWFDDAQDLGFQIPKFQITHCAYFSQGYLMFISYEPCREMWDVFKRFAKVFEQTYTRFLDLKKAEAQAREAMIEASLERVRSKAMAMYSSEDLSATVNVFFRELKKLGIIPIRCGVGQIDEASRTTSLTTTTSSQQGNSYEVIGKIKQAGHPILDGIFDHWKLQKEYHPVLEGADIKAYYDVMNSQISYPNYPEGVTQYGNCFYFKEGFVFAWTDKDLPEDDLKIFRRFTSVLSLTYRRYLDLKETEARAFEAVRQSSLDRVRAEIASMRTAEDLNRITPIIWHELKVLEVPFIRCGVFIIDETQNKVQVYLTTPDGKSLGVLHLLFNSNKLTSNTVEFWRRKEVYKEHWNKDEFIRWTKSMMELGQVQNAVTYQGSSSPPESLDLHFVPFSQGMLYVGDTSPLSGDKLDMVRTLAESFSIAYARYEDFKNLEEAKNKVDITLNELRAAQAQLIHSEKMASLGELTAGIAHEIKNPLNFVNNFSEISGELLDELNEELEKNNKEEVLALLNDLKQNLEKINQHGKRADSIVKGMLLHSRGTSGEKVLTDINDLLDQYVTLAYHGMRAQNKEFNITIERDYDKSVDKINVVPQDISRVFLNIINNACYAANERKLKSGSDFSPLLHVSTKGHNGKVEIRIKDNGNGIPSDISDKIFQPFFTTKPTGEGTGLGLSLSYDIITKVHSGELKLETEEGVGTEFTIILNK